MSDGILDPPDGHDAPLSDQLPSRQAESEEASATETPTRKFCPRCGAPWDPAWTDCQHCQQLAMAAARRTKVLREGGPRLRVGLSLYFALLACMIVLALIGRGADIDWPTIRTISTLALAGITTLWVIGTKRRLFPVLRTTTSWRWLALGVSIGSGTFLLATLLISGLIAWAGVEREGSNTILDGTGGWPMAILIVCVFPGIFEELAFRGVIFESLRSALGAREVIVVSGLMFMILHLSPLSFPHLAIIGLTLGVVRLRSGSLYPCMVAHFTHNLLCVIEGMRQAA